MKARIATACFTHPGRRDNNEDAIFPDVQQNGSAATHNLFMVCDGMGGHQKGEVASNYVCTQMFRYFEDNNIQVSDKNTIRQGIRFVELKLDEYLTEHPEASSMGSTLCLLHLHADGATIAHVGDSRVYLFRNGKVSFHTRDHSFVQRLFDVGAITREEMSTHPRKNEIYKAIRGASIQEEEPEVTVLTDLQANDIFFLCSDGVMESFSEAELELVFDKLTDIQTISTLISQKCLQDSTDNFSAYFIQLVEPPFYNP